jgi:hypothetical protein
MRQWMGDANFVTLQQALLNAGFRTYKSEPDLFCWSPDTGERFFAEAKGRTDHVKPHQPRWFEVCRAVLPDVKIVVFNLRPDSMQRARQKAVRHRRAGEISSGTKTLSEGLADLPDGGTAATVFTNLCNALAASSLKTKLEPRKLTIMAGAAGPTTAHVFLAAVYKTTTKALLWSSAGESAASRLSCSLPPDAVKGILERQRDSFAEFGGVPTPSGGQVNIDLATLAGREADFVQALELLAEAIAAAGRG